MASPWTTWKTRGSHASRRAACKEGFLWTLVESECHALLLRDPGVPLGHACPQASEHSGRGAIPGSGEKLCLPRLEGHLSLGKSYRKENFFHTTCWCGWLEACLYLTSCVCVNVSAAILWTDSVWLCICPWERYSSRRRKDNVCPSLQFYASDITGK